MLIDTHCHLDLLLEHMPMEQVLDDAALHKVSHIIMPSIDADNWQAVTTLALQHSCLYYALGFHPCYLTARSLQQLPLLVLQLEALNEKALSSSKCVAIGECGLDFWHGREQQALQTRLLREQIILANRFQLPIILHCRKAHQEMIAILKQTPPQYGGVIHGFSGSFEQAQDYIKRGIFIGVGGVISYPRAQKTRQTIARLPLDVLVLETDAPDMPLNGYQGQHNQPKQVKLLLEHLADLRQEEKANVSLALYHNSKRLFGFC